MNHMATTVVCSIFKKIYVTYKIDWTYYRIFKTLMVDVWIGVLEMFKTLIIDVKFLDSDCGCVWYQYVIQEMRVCEEMVNNSSKK